MYGNGNIDVFHITLDSSLHVKFSLKNVVPLLDS